MFAGFGAHVSYEDGGDSSAVDSFHHSAKHRVEGASSELLAAADVVIQSSAVDGLEQPLEPVNERQVVLRISPFAATGPYADWRSTDLVDAAIAGHLRLSGDPEREPLQGVPDLVHHAAGAMGFISATAALVGRARSGRGQLIELSHQETIAALHQFTLCRYTHNGAILNRLGNRYAGPGTPIGAYECADGWVGLAIPQEDMMERLLEVTGLITMLDRDDVDSVMHLMTDTELLDRELIPYLKTQPKDELVELFQALRLPCAPVASLEELLRNEHLEHRQFWHPSADVTVPGAPFRLSGSEWASTPSTLLSTVPGSDDSAVDGNADDGNAVDGNAQEDVSLDDGPLTGLRVLDMTRVWAGPLATRILADLGAEVLMTEVPWTRTPREVADAYVQGTHFFPDDEGGDRPWNRSGFHNKYAINKLSTVIELDKEEGRELFAALVPTADVLVENYSPRVMPGFGFDEDTLHQLNPELVYVTMPGYGRSGPHSDWVAYGPTIDGHVGHTTLTGYRDEGPWKCGIAWPDPIGGMHGAAAALVGLVDRFVSPSVPAGQTIEVAQIESAINMIGHHVVTAQTDGPPARWGNRRPGRFQGVYRCAGGDRWIAISVMDDRAWSGLCQVLGLDDLASINADQRWQRHDELDARVEVVTAARNDIELMAELQASGTPAGAALDAADLLADPQLLSLDFFVELNHADAGIHRWNRFPARFSLTPASMRLPAALMGEHNHYAVCELAGYDESRLEELLERGIVRVDPPA